MTKNPTYGYGETLPVYFNQAPVFQVSTGTGGAGGGEGGQAAPARPGEEQLTNEQRQQQQSPFFTPPNLRPRVVLRFAADEKNLLVSGMLAGGSELANTPAVIDVPVGRGHVVLFANNPTWRHQTQGSFFLIFNAALNYDSLGTERAPETPSRRPQAATGEEQR